MRIVITALAAVAVAGLAFSADAAPSNNKKRKHTASKERTYVQRSAPSGQTFGYDASPEHYRTGSQEWWHAMDREGRGGCCGTP